MPETTPLIKAALNLRGGAGFDVYVYTCPINVMECTTESAIYVMGLTVVELRMFFSKLTTNSSAFIVSN